MQSFRLQGIKGFLDTGDIEIRPLTIIVGENSSGKSSILRFPLVLRQTFLEDSMAPLLFYGKSVDYGNYEDVVFGHDKRKPIAFSFKIPGPELFRWWRIAPARATSLLTTLENGLVNIAASVMYRRTGIVMQRFHISLEGGPTIFDLQLNTKTLRYALNTIDPKTGSVGKIRIPSELSFDGFVPRNFAARNSQNAEFIFRTVYNVSRWFNSMAQGVQYIGPFRRTPERSYRYTDHALSYVGADGYYAPMILGQDLRHGGKLIRRVSEYLGDLGFELSVQDLRGDNFKLLITDHKTKAQNNLIDVGHGLSQLIPITVQTLMENDDNRRSHGPNSGELCIVEQPELHLHPAAQSSLADLFLAGIRQSSPKRFLIETHSEHLLIRLRRYIVEGRINPSEVALYYTAKNPENGSISVTPLTIDENGDIGDWPEGFFSEDYEEALKLREARMSKLSSGGHRS